jgi:hypothetical protein
MQDVGCRIQDSSARVQDLGVLTTGFIRMQDSNIKTQD